MLTYIIIYKYLNCLKNAKRFEKIPKDSRNQM